MTKQASVRIGNLCFAYESEMILKHISLEIKPNHICFIMGNNGSGKTTLLKNIMGFLIPQSGQIEIDGINVSTIDKKTLSKTVSYVPQAIHLNTDFSVIDYLALGRTPYLGIADKLSEEDYEIIEKYSVRLGIDAIYDVPFNKLSGGQKQMVAIARSLIQDTPVLILDEPMSALDIGKQVDLLKLLHDLSQEDKTIIMTTHNPNHAMTIESDACFLQHGEIVAFGSSEAIIQESLIHEIYGDKITLDYGEKYASVVFDKNAIG